MRHHRVCRFTIPAEDELRFRAGSVTNHLSDAGPPLEEVVPRAVYESVWQRARPHCRELDVGRVFGGPQRWSQLAAAAIDGHQPTHMAAFSASTLWYNIKSRADLLHAARERHGRQRNGHDEHGPEALRAKALLDAVDGARRCRVLIHVRGQRAEEERVPDAVGETQEPEVLAEVLQTELLADDHRERAEHDPLRETRHGYRQQQPPRRHREKYSLSDGREQCGDTSEAAQGVHDGEQRHHERNLLHWPIQRLHDERYIRHDQQPGANDNHYRDEEHPKAHVRQQRHARDIVGLFTSSSIHLSIRRNVHAAKTELDASRPPFLSDAFFARMLANEHAPAEDASNNQVVPHEQEVARYVAAVEALVEHEREEGASTAVRRRERCHDLAAVGVSKQRLVGHDGREDAKRAQQSEQQHGAPHSQRTQALGRELQHREYGQMNYQHSAPAQQRARVRPESVEDHA
ncbi:hypothetical protein ON010_g14372 [Phytophthora cinnamomi]|nr:hypothetical protein ON010_g14372 [Phytophthora cinnamomi]